MEFRRIYMMKWCNSDKLMKAKSNVVKYAYNIFPIIKKEIREIPLKINSRLNIRNITTEAQSK